MFTGKGTGRTFVGVAVQFLRIGNKEMSGEDRIVRVCRLGRPIKPVSMRGTLGSLRMRDVGQVRPN